MLYELSPSCVPELFYRMWNRVKMELNLLVQVPRLKPVKALSSSLCQQTLYVVYSSKNCTRFFDIRLRVCSKQTIALFSSVFNLCYRVDGFCNNDKLKVYLCIKIDNFPFTSEE